MKIGVSSYSFAGYIKKSKCDYFHICDKVKEYGFDGIEFVDLDFPGFNITDNPLKCAENIRAYCERINLPIFAYTVGADFTKEGADAQTEHLYKCVDIAKVLGAPILRHDICRSLPDKYLYSYRNAIDDFAPYIRKVADYAENLGIKTCTENHGFVFQSPDRVEQLIQAVGHKNFGWLCDMGNFLCTDNDPSDAFRIAAPYAFHVHAKDFLFKKGNTLRPDGFFETASGNYLRGTVIGHGIVPIENCISILKKQNYNGVISIEFEGFEDTEFALKSGLSYLKKFI